MALLFYKNFLSNWIYWPINARRAIQGPQAPLVFSSSGRRPASYCHGVVSVVRACVCLFVRPCVLASVNSSFKKRNFISYKYKFWPHTNFNFVLIVSALYFFFPIQITLVLSKFMFKPDNFENLDGTFNVLFKDLSDLSRIILVTSANCERLNSVWFIFIPFIGLLFLMLMDKISAHKMKM